MTVPELIKALQSLQDDENNTIAECEVFVYCEEKISKKLLAEVLIDGEMLVSRVERDADNVANEVTLYFKRREK